jgi:hypothetical protein
MQPVRGSKGRSVRQNRNGSNSGAGNNGHSGNRIVTHPEKGTGQHFLNIRRKAVVREGKPQGRSKLKMGASRLIDGRGARWCDVAESVKPGGKQSGTARIARKEPVKSG